MLLKTKILHIMFVHLVSLITATFLVNSVNSKEGCDKAVDVKSSKPNKLKWEVKLPLRSPKCIFSAFGTAGCEVEIFCQVDIPKSDDCEDDYIKISDGVYGEKRLCGKDKGSFMANVGLRHLFVVLETKGNNGQVVCTAKCSRGGQRLEKNKKYKIENRCACGYQDKNYNRIVGGKDAKMNEFPWLSAIVFPRTRSPICGASIINDRYVLCAAHCFWFEDKTPSEIEILFHAHTLDMTKKAGARDVALGKDGSIQSSGYNLSQKTDEDEKSQRFQVVEIINHPLFNDYYDNDYALLRLSKKIDLSSADAPTPICLPPVETWDSLMPTWRGKMFTVAGWGLAAENAGGSTRVLQKVDVPFIAWPKCKKRVPSDLLTRRMLCAGYDNGGKDACQGDSGGPLMYKMPKTDQFWQVGIVSWGGLRKTFIFCNGEGCARKRRPGIYSRVTEMVQWIHFHSSEGEAKWCDGPRLL